MKTEPQKEHQWLQKLANEWRYESEAACEPGQPAKKFTGSEGVGSVSSIWVLCDGRSEIGDELNALIRDYFSPCYVVTTSSLTHRIKIPRLSSAPLYSRRLHRR